ncbi:response regulator [Metabacillus endolithicus]|uniref:Response regulator n=1 Tax=Metabacillus endolithicus TaxID=1535204 RepID=A0ABW5BYF2_9BACI|nr:response regulator [Metabacillus endolithicus]UPG65228.1 response regulator [Metabacillus endolithicus]
MKVEVMVIEDDARIAEINSRFTKKIDGFEVVAIATSGAEAIELLEIIQPQLVLLDVFLPDMLGTDLGRVIRKSYPDIDIIMITASSEVDIVGDSLRNGVCDYIVKPVTFERFKTSLEAYQKRLEKLKTTKHLTQEEITALWSLSRQDSHLVEEDGAPKGIDPLTLNKILEFLLNVAEEGITAESLSKQSGVSRSTARRYLEYLISQKKVYAELVYGNVGRPERRYFRFQS